MTGELPLWICFSAFFLEVLVGSGEEPVSCPQSLLFGRAAEAKPIPT